MPRHSAIPTLPLALLLVLTGATLWFATPRPAHLSEHASGDPALAAELRRLAPPDGHQSIAASVITLDSVVHAAIGEQAPGSGLTIRPADPIELGSITKTFNGLLLADAVSRGEVGLEDALESHLPRLTGTPVGRVTLAELATHRSGVPPLPPSLALEGIPMLLDGSNPYAAVTKEEVLAEVRDLGLTDSRGEEAYSNLGAALLGWALADATGSPDWNTYVHRRLLDPLGVEATFASVDEEVPPGTVPGFTSNGFRPDHWVTPGFQPPGAATYVTPAAVTAYAQAVLAGRVPGREALAPLSDTGSPDLRTGLHWYALQTGEQVITWHNGGTGGFRTMLALDLEADRAVFVVGNTDASVDELGLALLTGAGEPSGAGAPWWPHALVPGVAALLVAGALWSGLRGKDRPAIVSAVAGAVFGLVVARVLGSWALVGAWAWVLLVLLTAVAVVLALRRWPAVPWRPRRHAVLRWIATGLSAALALGALALAV